MRAFACGAALALVMCATSSAGVALARAPVPAAVEPPGAVLAKYEQAMDGVAVPKFLRFEYAVDQAGPRDFAQTHRVYRSGLVERDEILSIDGQTLTTPAIRIIRDRINRYNIAVLAPRARDYAFLYVGHHRDGARVEYVFSTLARSPGAFAITDVIIDGAHFLPRTIVYTSSGDELSGHGTMTFAPQGRYWVITQATATAHFHGKVARERLTFHNYDFPRSLPESTFTEPRSQAGAATQTL